MAKMAPVEVVIKVEGLERVKEVITEAQAAAWQQGMEHSLSWLGERDIAPALRRDNPYRKAPPAMIEPPKSCPTRLMDGRNEIRCWLTEGHDGDHK